MTHPYLVYKIVPDVSSQVPSDFDIESLDKAKINHLKRVSERNKRFGVDILDAMKSKDDPTKWDYVPPEYEV